MSSNNYQIKIKSSSIITNSLSKHKLGTTSSNNHNSDTNTSNTLSTKNSTNTQKTKRTKLESLPTAQQDNHILSKSAETVFKAAIAACNLWEAEVESNYSEDDACTIDGFLSHFENEYYGYSYANDCYESNVESDLHGVLLAEAKVGWQLFKRLHGFEAQYPDLMYLHFSSTDKLNSQTKKSKLIQKQK